MKLILGRREIKLVREEDLFITETCPEKIEREVMMSRELKKGMFALYKRKG